MNEEQYGEMYFQYAMSIINNQVIYQYPLTGRCEVMKVKGFLKSTDGGICVLTNSEGKIVPSDSGSYKWISDKGI